MVRRTPPLKAFWNTWYWTLSIFSHPSPFPERERKWRYRLQEEIVDKEGFSCWCKGSESPDGGVALEDREAMGGWLGDNSGAE